MGLTRKVAGGWQGVVTGRLYAPPRECEQSAEAQERKYADTLPLRLPENCEPGSAEEVRIKIQQEALSNAEQAYVRDTGIGYKTFCAHHPEYPQRNANAQDQLLEWFHLNKFRFVMFNDAYIPLEATAENFEEAYQWKIAMGTMPVDPSVMDAKERLKFQEEATKRFKTKPTEDDLYGMPMEQLRAMGFERD